MVRNLISSHTTFVIFFRFFEETLQKHTLLISKCQLELCKYVFGNWFLLLFIIIHDENTVFGDTKLLIKATVS